MYGTYHGAETEEMAKMFPFSSCLKLRTQSLLFVEVICFLVLINQPVYTHNYSEDIPYKINHMHTCTYTHMCAHTNTHIFTY